jgi:hypothetical protein
MKPQQRNFIVEIKSRGRRSTSSQGSIWGSTDIKAFARQAESDAPQLFAPILEASAAAEVREILPVSIPVESQIRVDSPDLSQMDEPATMSMTTAKTSKPSGQPVAIDPFVEGEVARIEPMPEDHSPELPSENVVVARREPAKNVVRASAAFTDEDLSSLESENSRLKKMLAERLRDQNAQLRRMLSQFDPH